MLVVSSVVSVSPGGEVLVPLSVPGWSVVGSVVSVFEESVGDVASPVVPDPDESEDDASEPDELVVSSTVGE